MRGILNEKSDAIKRAYPEFSESIACAWGILHKKSDISDTIKKEKSDKGYSIKKGVSNYSLH